MRAIYVPLAEPTRRALNDLAERLYRDPRDQAAFMLTEALLRAGALGGDPPLDGIGPAQAEEPPDARAPH